MTQYTSGKLKKSRREKEQEAAEAKKREEAANAAKAYAEFLDAFEGEDRKTHSTFVKAGTAAESGPTYGHPAASSERKHHGRNKVSFIVAFWWDGVFIIFSLLHRQTQLLLSPRANVQWMLFLKKLNGQYCLHSVKMPYSFQDREQAEREARYSRHGHLQLC